ncbi:MAG: hypothetical protein COZ49_01705 [Candidatus Yonathbacteria bacterium CG_4_10_14_3_um_filter_47_65]|uniref:DUF192 domain-containing protein n=1 Tax=Candidatus Yonathbacteria bacterium CG_4_9_14_0_8_um_filter_46_47 TaxID=1975106 RepID=A0A2M8D823_9BACT|nr:MAG: hypothetical protein COX54_00760 [Candidatus Yonathbacteria bacterium CG23_combo_of_CG06-09_8_20_14_all_46_18]PIQ31264.1 MAG: hypothetical protein COW61_04010 [Candidatus Yonathbacteria bacterium CG17_big_fil_post_rev_8_21_14_2_50_46_19]PIX56517.1 MAG: hypothetical protein COZ49_01705 [Candidatus Yonathbacteria bacterium CG_4_10_14_3_um_filter_47_65]PIY57769.1 MAG: hypothetical protein COY99_01485 [Candidatus Yonathbacteria bacterium CG_4_10_14_0_8_um_filter_47_645]PJB83322.1 MAG: hypot
MAIIVLAFYRGRGNFAPQETPPPAIGFVAIGDSNFAVDIAETDQTRARGLSGKQALTENGGMLFIFDKSDIFHFWMK